eukprot:TRINITY_DN52085_c0_g1_i1.p1 TRINITY_DN52085_c0_g1~~TRINITY_DN52085_c0_g1_i1.p1  ORF type:complete len:406 (-),score=69.30 TRINITY_DN52085_c0_g1_i1:84-1301(-)
MRSIARPTSALARHLSGLAAATRSKNASTQFKAAWLGSVASLQLSSAVQSRNQRRGFADASSAHPPVRILKSDVGDILFHFALEEFFMQNATLAGPVMYLWRPSPVVTIGRHQNPWKECVLSKLEADGVGLVRRRSGGGAVFQDPGCSVFTFLAPSDHFSIDRNFDVVIGALRRLGVEAERQGRNDMTLDGKKISGSAFKHAPDRRVSLHHGTILINTDFQALQRYLTPDKRKLEAKGIKSVGARVINLGEAFPGLDHDKLCDALIAEFREVYAAMDAPVEQITEESDVAMSSAFKGYHAELDDKEWRLGRTPEFSHHLETRIDGVGVFDVRMEVQNGKIKDVVIFSDALYPDIIDIAMAVLVDVSYGRAGVGAALDSLKPMFLEDGPRLCLDAFATWLTANLDD